MTILSRLKDEKVLAVLLRGHEDELAALAAHEARKADLEEQAQHREQVMAKNLPGLRDQEQELEQDLADWFQAGLDLFDRRVTLESQVRACYGRPRAFKPDARLLALLKRDRDRLRVVTRGPRDRTAAQKERTRQLKDFAKEQARSARSMAGGDGSGYQAQMRVAQTEAAVEARDV